MFFILESITILSVKLIKIGGDRMSHIVTLRLSDEEYNNLKQALQRTGLLQSEFIRNALSNQVHAVMQVKSIK